MAKLPSEGPNSSQRLPAGPERVLRLDGRPRGMV
jgi:hypothetical protein